MVYAYETYILAFLFLSLSAIAGFFAARIYFDNRKRTWGHFLLPIITICFFFLGMFTILVGLGFSVEFSTLAPCENVINSTIITNNTTTYTYVDSCDARTTPTSIESLYRAYAYILYAILMMAVIALMFLGVKKVLLEW